MKRLLPIGMQDFPKLREEGFCYVDKTACVHRLLTGSGQNFFLSRPRRFGKSLLSSTLGAVFEGRRELFGEIAGAPALAINSLEWEWKQHPVIYIDLNPGAYSNNGKVELYANLNRDLELCAKKYGAPFTGETVIDRFARLIQALHEHCGQRVVVLIDEYDKPLLETIDDRELHVALRDELKGFYGVLKPFDRHLRFVFITGVSKFSHVSIFSDLNHLVDLTLNPAYADICGLTQEEVEQNFGPEIEAFLEETGKSREGYMEELRLYYNGYRFSKKPLKVYNPFGLLNHFNVHGDFLPYWYETGSPSFLMKLINEQKINILDLNNMRVGLDEFGKYDIASMRAAPVLYQSGYLTIADYDEEDEEFVLDYPNLEVRSSFSKSLVRQYLGAPDDNASALIIKLPKALRNGDLEGAIEALRQFLASIPYDIIKATENYYETAVHIIFAMLGLNCRSEVRIAAGRIDTLVETKNFVYCFEFKLDGTADEALVQIGTKEYLLPWTGSGKKLFKVGVNFDHEKRNIGEWKCEVVEG